MAAWIKMPLGMEVGLRSGNFVLDGDPASPPKKKINARTVLYIFPVLALQKLLKSVKI